MDETEKSLYDAGLPLANEKPDKPLPLTSEQVVRISVQAAIIATFETLVLVRVLLAFIDYALKPK